MRMPFKAKVNPHANTKKGNVVNFRKGLLYISIVLEVLCKHVYMYTCHTQEW